jgi:N-acetylmuramoyl-L-alanine amidase
MERHRIFISAGHTNVPGDDMGATGIGGIMEGEMTVELRNKVVNKLKELGVHTITDPDNFNLVEDIAIINALLEIGDVAVDIHFNAFSKDTARGTEVLIPANPSNFESQLAFSLSEGISEILGTVDRGVKSESEGFHSRLGFMRPNCETILIEICFITNQQDLSNYIVHIDEVAEFIATTLYESLSQ